MKGVVEALREAGAEVLGVVAIFTYLLPASTQLFTSINCDFKTLSNYDVLVRSSKRNGLYPGKRYRKNCLLGNRIQMMNLG